VLVGVRDLEAAGAQWRRLGFSLTPPGRHIGWGSGNRCIMFAEDYVELLGILDPSRFCNNLDRFLAEREGLMGLAFAGADAAEATARLGAAGLHPDGPRRLERLLDLPEGEARLAFDLAFLPPQETPDLSAFLCCHRTPELLRHDPGWLAHANGAKRLVGITVVSQDPAAAALGYVPIAGEDGVSAGDGETAVTLGRHRIRFIGAAGFARRYEALGAVPSFAPPYPAALEIAVADLDAARRLLAAAGAAPADAADRVCVHPRDATGAVLELVPDRR
jgi:hypothetical protein